MPETTDNALTVGKPRVMIPLDKLLLDTQNPRLPLEARNKSQEATLEVLVRDFDLTELAYSMVENGYFHEEPLVVVPEDTERIQREISKPHSFDEKQTYYTKLLEEPNTKFIVVEGNRRLATAKILTSIPLRERYKFPHVEEPLIAQALQSLPTLVYERRQDVSAYLGVRHIAGILKWTAFAKVQYIKDQIDTLRKERNMSINEAIDTLRKQTGDTSETIRKQYAQYRIIQQAAEELEFDTKPIEERFSLLTVAFNAPNIRRYVGIQTDLKRSNAEEPIIQEEKYEALREVLAWIFGDRNRGIEPLIRDSRHITKYLSPILASEEATANLREFSSLSEAFELSEGEKDFLLKKINEARLSLKNAMKVAYRYGQAQDVRAAVEECEQAFNALKHALQQK